MIIQLYDYSQLYDKALFQFSKIKNCPHTMHTLNSSVNINATKTLGVRNLSL